MSIRLLAARQELTHSHDMSVTPDFSSNGDEGKCTLRFAESLTLLRVRKRSEQLNEITADGLVVDLSEVEKMDTVGAWLIHKLERDRGATIVGATEQQQLLIDHVAAADQPVKIKRDYESPVQRVLGQMGASVMMAGRTMLGLLGFFGALLITV